MQSPAQRHFARATAELAAKRMNAGQTMTGNSVYELHLVKLAADRSRLKAIQSTARKIDVKRDEILPEYVDYIDGVLAGGRGAQDDVLTTVMVWRLDVGDFDGALQIARYAIQHAMTLSDQFDRSLAAALAEEAAETALATIKQGGTVNVAQLEEIATLTQSTDMHDQVRAKLMKAIGYAHMESQPAVALDYLRQALAKNEQAGVKQDIKRLEKALDAG